MVAVLVHVQLHSTQDASGTCMGEPRSHERLTAVCEESFAAADC